MSFNMFRTVSALILAAFLGLPAIAKADGFVCISVDDDTRIDVYLTKFDTDGPAPTASKLVVSDPNRTPRYRHIATFDVADGVLQSTGTQVHATVDLTKPGTARAGERIGGTKLGLLIGLVLDIDVSYQEPIKEGVRYSAEVTYLKKSGQELTQDFDCILFKGTSPDKVQVIP
ncbi:MAG: hypothetical protein V4760_07275 [Bdellovibrionota bacterium]